MKNLIILFLLIPLSGKCQQNNVNARLDSIQINLMNAAEELNEGHTQYTTGVALWAVGLGFGICTPFLAGNDQNALLGLGIGAAVMTTAGIIVMIDAHRYIKKAAIYMKAGAGKFGIGIAF